MPFVVAVVVTYQPELSPLQALLDRLAQQVEAIVMVDNGSRAELLAGIEAPAGLPLHTIPLGENLGIARAQNEGVARARALGATHVVLFDHDSLPAPDMVACLLACEHSLSARGRRVASVGPCYEDARQKNPPPFVRVVGGRLQRCLHPEDGDAVSVDYLIASGCLIPVAVLDQVGVMNEDLFIDYVDIEWGLRARSHGLENFGCFSARMSHALGDAPIVFLGKAYPSHSPLRHYYLFRNEYLLYRLPHIPAAWKLCNWRRSFLRFGFYLLFARPWWSHARMIFRGIRDGLFGRFGKFSA